MGNVQERDTRGDRLHDRAVDGPKRFGRRDLRGILFAHHAGKPGGYVGQKGVWGFEDLVAGTYTVRVEEILGWRNVGSGAYTTTLASGKVLVGVPFWHTKIVMPATGRSTIPPPPRYIGELSPEVDLTSASAGL